MTLNRSGFSLVGVLVAASIMGILAVAFSKIFNNSLKGQSTVNKLADVQGMQSLVQSLVLSQASCKASLAGGGAPFVLSSSDGTKKFKVVSDGLFLGSPTAARVGAPQLKAGSNFGGLAVTEIKLSLESALIPASGSFQTVADLTIASKYSKEAFGSTQGVITIKVPVTIDSTGTISSCGDKAADDEDGDKILSDFKDDNTGTAKYVSVELFNLAKGNDMLLKECKSDDSTSRRCRIEFTTASNDAIPVRNSNTANFTTWDEGGGKWSVNLDWGYYSASAGIGDGQSGMYWGSTLYGCGLNYTGATIYPCDQRTNPAGALVNADKDKGLWFTYHAPAGQKTRVRVTK